jgi:hypothetical protein
MIAWQNMDERERAVWSATVAVHFVNLHEHGFSSDKKAIEFATNLAERAVYALREVSAKESRPK